MTSISRSRFYAVAILFAASLVANLFLFAKSIRLQPPFVMMMTPAPAGGATVQFIQPLDWNGKSAASPEFHVDVELAKPFVASLTSGNVEIPGAAVELGDVTLFPGAFHLRFGDDAMQVMSSRVHWRGKDYAWEEERPRAGGVEGE